MPSYLVETYLSRSAARERVARELRARAAAAELAQRYTPICFERSIYIPEDEICFFVFDAPSARHAALAAERAQLDPIRVVEAIPSRDEPMHTADKITDHHEQGRRNTR